MTAPIDTETRSWATALAQELEATHHEVVLIEPPRKAHRNQMIRRAVGFLPDWYCELMRGRASIRTDRHRHFQTAIKRRSVLIGLRQIALGHLGRYADELLGVIDSARRAAAAADVGMYGTQP